MEMRERGSPALGFAWYKPEQWARLREVSADAAQLESDYESWRRKAEDAMLQLQFAGIDVKKVIVDVEDIVEWCRTNGLEVTSASRSKFAARKVREGQDAA